MKVVIEKWLLLALLCAGPLPGTVLAEQADRDKPIQVEANSVRMDELNKLATYEGSVVLTQGTLMLVAERVVMRQDAQGFSIGEATGMPARFKQKMDGREEYVEGHANRLEYDARSDLIRLVGSARLKRGEEDLRGEVITYNTRSEVYQAKGVAESSGGSRVRAIIMPRGQTAGAAGAGKGVTKAVRP